MNHPFQLEDQEAVREVLDVQIYSAIVDFVMTIAGQRKGALHRAIQAGLFYQTGAPDIQSTYGFRYLGEMLERYEERIGTNPRILRAIALALAHTKEVVTDDMYNGKQWTNFIKRLRKLSAGDTYLQGALLLLENKQSELLARIIISEFSSTIELAFWLSLTDDEQAVFTLRDQISALFGLRRTMPAMGNTRIYEWLIRRISPILKRDRSKGAAFLRQLAALPTTNAKPGSKCFEALKLQGYTPEEIVYLNHTLLKYRPVPDSILPKSITEIKIAMEMCRCLLNSETALPSNTYQYVMDVITRYQDLPIKVGGHESLWNAVKDSINPGTITAFVWLHKTIQNHYSSAFRFDILDSKWDELASHLNPEEYTFLFDWNLPDHAQDGRTPERVTRYAELIGKPYLSTFDTCTKRDRIDAFVALINGGIVSPVKLAEERWPTLESLQSTVGNGDNMLSHIRKAVKGVHSREAFLFFRYLFQYPIGDIPVINDNYEYDFSKDLCHYETRNYGISRIDKLTIQREFLSQQETRELFGWLDEYMFMYAPNKYDEFCVCVLRDDFMDAVLPFEDRKALFLALMDSDSGSQLKHLKTKYLSDDELQADKEREAQEKADKEQRQRDNERKHWLEQFAKECDGTIASLEKFRDRHDYRAENETIVLQLVKQYLDAHVMPSSELLTAEEIGLIAIMASRMMLRNLLDFDGFLHYIQQLRGRLKLNEHGFEAESVIHDA